jgi:uncharacterized protein
MSAAVAAPTRRPPRARACDGGRLRGDRDQVVRRKGRGNGLKRPRMGARPVVALVHLYQRLRVGRPARCRYIPSCSQYAAEALEERGVVVGLALSAVRLCRCHPWGGHGYDPVPASRRASRRMNIDADGDARTEG